MLEDFDGDGLPDELPDDYPDTGVEPYTLIEDEDDDNDGMSDTNESIIGTNLHNPDTDGTASVMATWVLKAFATPVPDSHPLDPPCRSTPTATPTPTRTPTVPEGSSLTTTTTATATST